MMKRKSVVAERFIRILKNKSDKYLTAVSKKLYIDNLDNIVNECNTYHSTIKTKPPGVKFVAYIDFGIENNDKNPKYKAADFVQISKLKNILAKVYSPNWFEEVFLIKKVKNTVKWMYVTENLNGEEIVGTFYERELQIANQAAFTVEKVM